MPSVSIRYMEVPRGVTLAQGVLGVSGRGSAAEDPVRYLPGT